MMIMDEYNEYNQNQEESSIEKLIRFSKSPNICSELDEQQLIKIGRDVVKWTDIDDASRADWLKKSEDSMKLALQITQEKTFPWQGASNIIFPLLTTAALQFHARAYPAMVNGNKIVKGLVNGIDSTGEKLAAATRVASYMNYQLIEEMPEWDEEMDKLLLALPVEGCEFKKSFFDPSLGRNVSEWIRPNDFIVHYKTKNLAICPRMTHRLWFYPQEIEERQRSNIWRDVDLNLTQEDKEEEILQEFYEQHIILDLDQDGYKEPYCITVHKDSEKVVRIKASFYPEDVMISGGKIVKIKKTEYFTKFSFIPSPDGGFYDLGFGQLINSLSNGVNTALNQLIDAGTLNNLASGFKRKGTKIGQKSGGSIRFEMGEFKDIDIPTNMSIDQAIWQMKFMGPSPVLFNLLGMLIQATKDITGIQDIMTGDTPKNETATTTMARIEQGLKVFSAIFKRVWRGLNEEFQKLYKLNAVYLQPETYFRVLDDNSQGVVTLQDFRNDGTDIRPVADPSLGTTMQKMAKAQLLMGLKGDPTLNIDEINKRFLDAAEIDSPEKLIIPPEQRQAPPDPKMMEIELKALKQKYEAIQLQAETAATYARAMESIANAESKEQGTQFDLYMQEIRAIKEHLEVIGNAQSIQGGINSVEAQPSNEGSIQNAQGNINGMAQGISQQPELEQSGQPSPNMPNVGM